MFVSLAKWAMIQAPANKQMNKQVTELSFKGTCIFAQVSSINVGTTRSSLRKNVTNAWDLEEEKSFQWLQMPYGFTPAGLPARPPPVARPASQSAGPAAAELLSMQQALTHRISFGASGGMPMAATGMGTRTGKCWSWKVRGHCEMSWRRRSKNN